MCVLLAPLLCFTFPAVPAAVIVAALAGVVGASSAAAGADGTTAPAPSAPRARAHGFPPVFTHPPTPVANVSSVRPLGNVNGTSHIIPVNHMYLRYPNGLTGGDDTIPLRAMGAGELVMDRSPGARVNPDPAAVSATTGNVCYDLRYPTEAGERFNALVLRLSESGELWIFHDPTPSATPTCSERLAAGVDRWTAAYVR